MRTPRRVRVAVLVVAVAVLVAGCADDPPVADEEGAAPAPGEAVGTASETVAIPFSKLFGVGTPVAGAEQNAGGPFRIAGGAERLMATATWSCATGPLCSLALVLFQADEIAGLAEGTSPLQLQLGHPAPGAYDAIMFADRTTVSVVVMAEGGVDIAIEYALPGDAEASIDEDAATP